MSEILLTNPSRKFTEWINNRNNIKKVLYNLVYSHCHNNYVNNASNNLHLKHLGDSMRKQGYVFGDGNTYADYVADCLLEINMYFNFLKAENNQQ